MYIMTLFWKTAVPPPNRNPKNARFTASARTVTRLNTRQVPLLRHLRAVVIIIIIICSRHNTEHNITVLYIIIIGEKTKRPVSRSSAAVRSQEVPTTKSCPSCVERRETPREKKKTRAKERTIGGERIIKYRSHTGGGGDNNRKSQ